MTRRRVTYLFYRSKGSVEEIKPGRLWSISVDPQIGVVRFRPMLTISTFKQTVLVGFVVCVLAAACSSNDGGGDELTATTTTTGASVADTATTVDGGDELTATTTTTGASVADTATTVDDGHGHPHDDETTTSLVYPVVGPGGAQEGGGEIVAEPEPDPADLVICGEGLVKIDELITDEDNGCRPETCAGERGANGQCLIIEDELLTEEEAAELLENAELVPWEEYGPEGCTQVSPGVCEDASGVLLCDIGVDGWQPCPGGSSNAEACPTPASGDPLALTGSRQTTGAEVNLTEGEWVAEICVRGNDLTTGQPSQFTAVVHEPDFSFVSFLVPIVQEVVDGDWTQPFTLDQDRSLEVAVTPAGGGTWTITFTKTDSS